MAQKGCYRLEMVDQLVVARFYGEWTAAADLEFMNRLCGMFKDVQKKGSWGFFVDMRDWYIDKKVLAVTQQVKHDLDRRNQKSECWLVSNDLQGHFLLPLFEQLPFDLHRHHCSENVYSWMQEQKLATEASEDLVRSFICDKISEQTQCV